MFPTPLTRVWSSRSRLTPAVRRRTRPTNASSSNAGSNGSRAMWAISGGSSAPPAETASPPNIRWSTKRSSSAPSPRRTRRWRSSGAPGTWTTSCPLMPRWPRRASPLSSGSHRYFPRRRAPSIRRPVSAVAKPAGPRWSRRTGRGCRTATEEIVRPTTWRSSPSRTVSTSGSSGTSVGSGRAGLGRLDGRRGHRVGDAQGAGQLAVRRLRGGLLGLLLGAADAVAVALLADPDLRGERLHVVGAVVLDEVLRHPEPVLGRELLQGGLPVEAGAERGRRVDQWVAEEVEHVGRALEPTRQVDRADHGLDGVGEDRGLLAAAGRVLAAAEL